MPIRNGHRTACTMLSGAIARRHGLAGLADDTIRIDFTGSAGQSFGAFLAHGVTVRLEGDANDYMGKGLSGGYAPLSAMAVREDIIQAIAEGTGSFVHGLTFAHTPMICAAGLAAVRYIKKHELVRQSAEMGKVLLERLGRLMDFTIIGDIRCKGLLAGIEFVEDKASKRPFPGALRIAERFTDTALQNGLVVWPNVGHIDGETGDVICLGPPLIITEEQIDEAVTLLCDTLSEFVVKLNA